MLFNIISWPPLGKDTHLYASSRTAIAFTVLLEFPVADEAAKSEWSVELWYSKINGYKWTALPLRKLTPGLELGLPVHTRNLSGHYFWYAGCLPINAGFDKVSFTIRLRSGDDPASWKWAREQNGCQDGRVFCHSQLALQHVLSNTSYMTGLSFRDVIVGPTSEALEITRASSDTPHTLLWHLTANIGAVNFQRPACAYFMIGTAAKATRWFALIRQSTAWLAPRQGRAGAWALADRDALLYSFERTDGLHTVVLTISGINSISTSLQSSGDVLRLQAFNEAAIVAKADVCVAIAQSFDSACAAVYYHARKMTSTYQIWWNNVQHFSTYEKRDHALPKIAAGPTCFRNWYDGLSYCTWNGIGIDLSEDKISLALQSLRVHGISVANVIIDDGWQSVSESGADNHKSSWVHFEADSKKFPDGLKAAITRLKMENPNIGTFAVWHALLGYWGGVSPKGSMARHYTTSEVHRIGPISGNDKITIVDQTDVQKMYDEFYFFLRWCGITAVKTDVQAVLEEISSPQARQELTAAYMHAQLFASFRHFEGRAMSCMSQSPRLMFRYQLTAPHPPFPTRNSDDYFPNEHGAHTWHVFCNAHNALFTKYLNVVPDWDMFQTSHPWGSWHAAAQCLSGGPVTITDIPRQHDVPLIQSMTAQTPKGQSALLRPSMVGRSVHSYVGFDENCLCKITAYNGDANSGSALMGLFNCKSCPLTEIISLDDFLGVDSGSWMVRSYRAETIGPILSAGTPTVLGAVKLLGYEWEVSLSTSSHGTALVY
ncbi:MAG: hypothetical protein M1828_001568 [Chrysothrix sp. TS-e1954]|nr:MAG: hypothetical protein M1828_001568 [Chrysothrix sp. TS-e1954]